MYPALSLPVPLKAASETGVNTEPGTTTIPAGGWSESIGFGGMAVSLTVRLEDDADAADTFYIQICDERTFTVVTDPADGAYDISNMTEGQIVAIRNLEHPGAFFRIFNDTSIPLSAKYAYTNPDD